MGAHYPGNVLAKHGNWYRNRNQTKELYQYTYNETLPEHQPLNLYLPRKFKFEQLSPTHRQFHSLKLFSVYLNKPNNPFVQVLLLLTKLSVFLLMFNIVNLFVFISLLFIQMLHNGTVK